MVLEETKSGDWEAEPMKIAVFGASGRTGRRLVSLALSRVGVRGQEAPGGGGHRKRASVDDT